MGAGKSHPREVHRREPQQPWQDADDGTEVEEVHVADLERSTAVDRQRNTLGLPDDVLRIIASKLDLKSLGRAARTCRTWRRIVYSDLVWRNIAEHEIGAEQIVPKEPMRTQVLKTLSTMKDEFVYLPNSLQPAAWKKVERRPSVMIFVFSKNGQGCGKTSLVQRLLKDCELPDFGTFNCSVFLFVSFILIIDGSFLRFFSRRSVSQTSYVACRLVI